MKTKLIKAGILIFTFHHVSIKTTAYFSSCAIPFYLHSTMYLLKPVSSVFGVAVLLLNLHSTMYLLKPIRYFECMKNEANLHSTMYLLKHEL